MCSLAALGSRRATCIARTGGALSGEGSAPTIPANCSRGEPKTTGMRCVVSAPPKTSAATQASVVQPEWVSKLA